MTFSADGNNLVNAILKVGGLNMAKMSKEVMDVFNDAGGAKVLATAGSAVLEINAVP